MKKRFHFEKLEAWEEARAFHPAVPRLSRTWPVKTVSPLSRALDPSYRDETALDELLASVDRPAATIVALTQLLKVAPTATPFARKRAFRPSSLDPRPSTPSRS